MLLGPVPKPKVRLPKGLCAVFWSWGLRRHCPETLLTPPEVEVDDGGVAEADLEEVGFDAAEDEGVDAPETNAAIGGPGNV